MKTRGVSFVIKPLNQYNDLYQNISVISGSPKSGAAKRFIDYLKTRSAEVIKLGLMSDGAVFDDEMKLMQNVGYEHKLTCPISVETYERLKNIIADGDINMLKNLLK